MNGARVRVRVRVRVGVRVRVRVRVSDRIENWTYRITVHMLVVALYAIMVYDY